MAYKTSGPKTAEERARMRADLLKKYKQPKTETVKAGETENEAIKTEEPKSNEYDGGESDLRKFLFALFSILLVPIFVGLAWSTIAHGWAWLTHQTWMAWAGLTPQDPSVGWIGPMFNIWLWLLDLVGLVAYFMVLIPVAAGTAREVKRWGGRRKTIMSWEGHILDERDRVVRGVYPEVWKRWLLKQFGGFRILGIRHLDYLHKYSSRWKDVHLDAKKGGTKVKFHDEVLDYILVRTMVLDAELADAETGPPEKVRVTILWIWTPRVVCPKKALFNAPPQYLEKAEQLLMAELRTTFVPKMSIDKLFELQKNRLVLWKELEKSLGPLLKMFRVGWGLHTPKGGLAIRDIVLPPDIADAAALEKKRRLEAVGFSAETMGSLIGMISELTDEEYENVQKEFKANLADAFRKYDPVVKANDEWVTRKLSLKGNALLDVRAPGEGLLFALAKVLRGEVGPGNNGSNAGTTTTP